MLKEERFNYILDKLRKESKVTAKVLSSELEVSEDTIRRDLHELSTRDLLKKVHGGAILKSTVIQGFDERLDFSAKNKVELVNKSMHLISDGIMIMIDGGTTNYAFVQHLPPLSLEVVTNSLPIAELLSKKKNIRLHLLGGSYYPEAKVFVGHETVHQTASLCPDLCVMGACSIHHEHGLTTPYIEENEVKKAMVNASQHTMVLATNDKVETAVRHRVCSLDKINYLVLEDTLDPTTKQQYQSKGLTII
ncbi:MAG: DeoR/GlpR family DNA-binding transcription regulator [Bacteroidota bacterium]